jgi:hypothetical protein
LEPGSYEISIATGDGRNQLDEVVWILEKQQYVQASNAAAGEHFLASPGLRGEREVATFVLDLIRERLEDDRFERDLDRPFSFEADVGFGAWDHVFPSGPIRWTTEQLVDEFREVALAGIERADWKLELNKGRYRLRCAGELSDPLSEAGAAAVFDPVSGFLSLLEKSEELSKNELQVQRFVEAGAREFFLSVSFGIDGFEVDER